MPSQMASLTAKASEAEKEQNEQVWKAFTQLLEQVETIFGKKLCQWTTFCPFCVRECWPVITVGPSHCRCGQCEEIRFDSTTLSLPYVLPWG
mgnify:CR=1 FL=1